MALTFLRLSLVQRPVCQPSPSPPPYPSSPSLLLSSSPSPLVFFAPTSLTRQVLVVSPHTNITQKAKEHALKELKTALGRFHHHLQLIGKFGK